MLKRLDIITASIVSLKGSEMLEKYIVVHERLIFKACTGLFVVDKIKKHQFGLTK